MKILHLDCSMGAAGDMLTAALLGLLDTPESFVREFNAMAIPGVRLELTPAEKCGVRGLHARMEIYGQEEEDHCHGHTHEPEHGHGHPHRGLAEIRMLLEQLPVSSTVRENAITVYNSIAQAEAEVHGQPMEQIHFHEVGSLDAVADVTAVCMLMERLAPDRVTATAVRTGTGQVRCAHGILPVPAPATVLLLQGIPTYGGDIPGEMCTPTGAALLRHFVHSFGPQPEMAVERTGYGMGSRNFPAANCLRAFLGHTSVGGDRIVSLACNLDDMTPEGLAFAQEQLLGAGALDVYITAVTMKKSRPGWVLTCLCRPEDQESITAGMLRWTTTLGVRAQHMERTVLERSFSRQETALGPVQIKTSRGGAICRSKAEYEDLAKIARQKGWSLEQAGKWVEHHDA